MVLEIRKGVEKLCNLLQNGDATFSIFICNFWYFYYAINNAFMLFDESICNRIDSNIRILLHNIWAVNRLFLSYAFNYCVIFVIIPQRYTVPRWST